MTFSVTQADAVSWLRALPSESADLGVTDPAYESLEKHRARGTTTRLSHSAASSNDWFQIFPNARFPDLFAELYRVLRPDTHLYVYCDPETAFVAHADGQAVGFRFVQPLVWDKATIGMGYHYRARYELVLLFEKGQRAVAGDVADVITARRITGWVCDHCGAVRGGRVARACCGAEMRRSYPTEKPISVSEVLVRQSSAPGELVIDPFMGSGSVGVAALRAGRRFAGADLASSAVELAGRRLAIEAGRWTETTQPASAGEGASDAT